MISMSGNPGFVGLPVGLVDFIQTFLPFVHVHVHYIHAVATVDEIRALKKDFGLAYNGYSLPKGRPGSIYF